jgi:hypothetical protein
VIQLVATAARWGKWRSASLPRGRTTSKSLTSYREGINSVVIYAGGNEYAVVRDRGVPAIVYLRSNDRTYSLGLERY